MSYVLRWCLTLFPVIAIASCGILKKDDDKKKRVKKYFVHGDPRVLVEGASFNEESIFTTDNYRDFDDFNLYGLAIFQNSEEVETTTTDNIEDGNAANNGGTTSSILHLEFRKSGGIYYYGASIDGTFQYLMSFTEDDGRLKMKEFLGESVNTLHYSVSSDKTRFSILLENYESPGSISAVYFTKNESNFELFTDVETIYNFILGPGKRAAWENDIDIDICGDYSDEQNRIFEKAITDWADEDGMIGSRKLNVRTVKEGYKPFSDINQHCFQLVDNYLFEVVENAAVAGITIPIANKTTRAIVSGHVFISKKGIEKIYKEVPSRIPGAMYRTSAHEFGHYIGLDHEFDDDYRSIMSYDRVDEIQSGDYKAADELYGKPFDTKE